MKNIRDFLKSRKGKVVILLTIISVILFGYWRYQKKQEFYDRVKKLMEVGIFKEDEFVEIDLISTNSVRNKTDIEFYDEIVLVGLNELGVDSLFVEIHMITDQAKDNFDIDSELRAHILSRGNQYVIWIDEMSRYEAIQVLSHELIHLVQYYRKDIIVERDYVMWKNRIYTYGDIERMNYRVRPWEVDAFDKDDKLKDRIESILYEE